MQGEREPLKINLQTNSSVIDKIKENLSEKLQKQFRETIFGYFLEFSITN